MPNFLPQDSAELKGTIFSCVEAVIDLGGRLFLWKRLKKGRIYSILRQAFSTDNSSKIMLKKGLKRQNVQYIETGIFY